LKQGVVHFDLRDGLIVGRAADAGIHLDDASVSRRHVAFRQTRDGWSVEDLGSRSGSYLNGRLFQREQLVIGDVLGIGPFHLRFDGRALQHAEAVTGARLSATRLDKTIGAAHLLESISFTVEPCQFVGIIGPSGAGKSTLLDALCGLRPATSGEVALDGLDLYEHFESIRSRLGYVPQDDIVPLELSVEDALFYSAWLRLPQGTPPAEIRRLVRSTVERLGLGDRLKTPVGRLSGGQRKRVSVGAELLCRPRMLFLDEPTSGLDPAAEFRLMENLRQLAAGDCTILCTTHVMENAYLFDRIAVLNRGRLVFFGEPAAAKDYFQVERLTLLYDRLEERAAEDWPPHHDAVPRLIAGSALPPQVPRPPALPILLIRQWAILHADWKNWCLLLGQPILIGVLVTWVTQDPSLVLFFAYIATLWFGCGNAAQEIVKELPMFRRERLIGLGRTQYLMAKFLTLACITSLQALLLYGVMQIGTLGVGGGATWQMGALIATAFASVSIGLAISGWARSILQAVMVVPLILIPQILFSGFTPPAGDMGKGPYIISRIMPSAAAQSMMDVSLFWGQKISGSMRVDYPSAFSNLNRDRSLKNGQIYQNPKPALWGLGTLLLWTAAGLASAWAFLRGKERG